MCDADAFALVHVDAFGAEFPQMVADVAGRIGGLLVVGLLHVELLGFGGDAVGMRIEHLVADVVGVALGWFLGTDHAVGRHQRAGILVAHVALGVVGRGVLVVVDIVGLHQLVGALDAHGAIEVVDRGLRAVHAGRVGVGHRRLAQAGVLGDRGVVELEHRVRPAHRIADRPDRAHERTELTGLGRRGVRIDGLRFGRGTGGIGVRASHEQGGGNGQKAAWRQDVARSRHGRGLFRSKGR